MCLILYVSLFAEFPREGQDRSPQPSPESRLFRHLSMCFCKYANQMFALYFTDNSRSYFAMNEFQKEGSSHFLTSFE